MEFTCRRRAQLWRLRHKPFEVRMASLRGTQDLHCFLATLCIFIVCFFAFVFPPFFPHFGFLLSSVSSFDARFVLPILEFLHFIFFFIQWQCHDVCLSSVCLHACPYCVLCVFTNLHAFRTCPSLFCPS